MSLIAFGVSHGRFRTFSSSLRCGLAVLLGASALACSSDSSDQAALGDGGKSTTSGDGGVVVGGGGAPRTVAEIPVPSGGKDAPRATPSLQLPQAADLGTVRYVANRSSVRLYLPGWEGARDYRVFAEKDGVKVTLVDGREHVAGADIYCAGLRQRNQCTDDAILPVTYNNKLLDMPKCDAFKTDRRPNVPTQVMQTLEVDGLAAETKLIVEAIDRQCPFPGIFGTKHLDVPIANVDIGAPKEQAVVNGKSYSLTLLPATFPLRTESEIIAQYGSMILNGQGPNLPTLDPSDPKFPESPFIRVGQPAPANDPVVLARSVVSVSPLGTSQLPDGFTASDFFDDFSDDGDQPKKLRDDDPANEVLGNTQFHVYENKKWLFYDIANQFSDFSINRGHMNMVFGDPYQDSMSLQAMYPKGRPFKLPDAGDKFLHITYEVQRNESPRRYENLALCGSDKPGDTYVGDAIKAAPMPRPGFMNEEGTSRTNTLGWNCLLLVGRGAGYSPVPGGDITGHSDTSLKVTVVRSHPAPAKGQYDGVTLDRYATAYGPTQEAPFPRRYVRQIDDKGNPSGPWLDDQTHIWQKTRFDVFVNRGRLAIYVEGQQRICQDLEPSAMTMAETAVGFWHILYHTSAEFTEIRRGEASDNPQTAQAHVMHNTPFSDWRSYDNVGVREDIGLPANFDAKRCYPTSP
ncbi:MAG TPA: hypothetical protein VI299_07175 [Polyangiales bacterium]